MGTVIIIGIASKIGLAAAIRFSKLGKKITGIDLPSVNWENVKKTLGEDFFCLPMDCSNLEQLRNNRDFLLDSIGNDTVLFLCLESEGKYQSQEESEYYLRSGTTGLLNVLQTVIPHMAKESGHIIILSPSDEGGKSSKRCLAGIQAFLKQYVVSLRKELKGTAVKLTYVDRSESEGEYSLASFERESEEEGEYFSMHTDKKYSPEELAELIYYLTIVPKKINITFLEIE